MRIARYLMQHKLAVLLVFILLMGQAICDLAIPNLTSQVVDIGIQQTGIEHAAVEEMTERTRDAISGQLSGADKTLFDNSYDYVSGDDLYGNESNHGAYLYVLNDYGRAHIDELDRVIARPLVDVHSADISQGNAAAVSAQGDDEVDLSARAIEAAKAEYAAVGYDTSALQMGFLAKTGLLMLGIAALGACLAICVGFLSARTGARIGHSLRSKLFNQVVTFNEGEIGKFSAASLITRGTNDIQMIQNVSIMMQRMVLYSPLLAIGGIVMVLATNASMGWIVVVAIVAVFVVIGIVFRIAMPKFRIMQKLIDRVNLVAREMLSGMQVIRAFGRQEFEQNRFDGASSDLFRTQLFTNRVMTFMMPVIMLIMNATSVAIVWFGSLSVDDGTFQTGDLIAFITYSMVIIMSFMMIGMISIMLPRANVAAERVDEVIACMPSIENPADPAAPPAPGAPTVAFNDVSFSYGDSDEYVLSNIDFTAEPGQTTAIIGATGAGKTTIVKLIERFYDVTEGSITLDGVDIRTMTQEDLRGRFGYVPQKAFLFSGTIGSNVAYSDENMPADRIELAVDTAQASDFIAEKPDGMKSEISQGGTNVSGGQRQRLSIARALATGARAFLFDDCFSALDYKTDAALRTELARNYAGATQIVVAQRIATIMHADKIIVLEDGRIVGEGTHEQLLAGNDTYREIALSQFSEEELEGGDGRG